jgi:hypothetical protein
MVTAAFTRNPAFKAYKQRGDGGRVSIINYSLRVLTFGRNHLTAGRMGIPSHLRMI